MDYNIEENYLYAKDGYEFNYYDIDDNKRMLKKYKSDILPIIKDFHLKRVCKEFKEFNIIDTPFPTINRPTYLYIPESKEELDNFISRVRDVAYYGTQCMDYMQTDDRYVVIFTDDDGEFCFNHYSVKELVDDMNRLNSIIGKLND